METYNIRVKRNQNVFRVQGKEGERLLDVLIKNGIYISAACGGKGICGKCKVQMTENPTKVTKEDRSYFSEEALAEGWRLACLAVPEADCAVTIESDDESGFEVVSSYQNEKHGAAEKKETFYEIGIDIGTTTIAIHLIGGESHQICEVYSAVNRQRAYGADVVSRIQASNEGKREELKRSIQKDLLDGICHVVHAAGISPAQVTRIAIAGNTTMGHLFMGYSCETLGLYPFTPVNIETISGAFPELFDMMPEEAKAFADTKVILLPGITTYVGADIVAGMLYCNMDRAKKPCLLIDLGTNGEMAVGKEGRFLVTSTAAGPAFEGGNISCGMGSVQGAICNVQIDGKMVQLSTIGKKAPIGLCGTGVIETVYELLKEELIDESGMLDEDYFDDGYELTKTPEGEPIVFTQKDVREIQLAKSAVRAGVETLLLRYGVTYDEIDTVYLAGGFGYKIDLKKAVGIGLLPEELREKIVAVGNSSLGGALASLTREDALRRMEQIAASSEEISLSADKDFNQFYMDYMFFDEI